MPTHETTSFESDNAVAAIKETQRNIWTSGDYAAVANLTDSTQPDHLLRLVSIEPGQRILDVATGSGNVALRAAKAGAEVIGLDLTPALLDKANNAPTTGACRWTGRSVTPKPCPMTTTHSTECSPRSA